MWLRAYIIFLTVKSAQVWVHSNPLQLKWNICLLHRLSFGFMFGEYHVDDYFYRIEFQARGAAHVHAVLWLVDSNGNPAPHFTGDDDSKQECEMFVDSIISGMKSNARQFHATMLCWTTARDCQWSLTTMWQDSIQNRNFIERHTANGCQIRVNHRIAIQQ